MSASHKWLALAVDILAYETEHWRDGDLLSQACDSWIEQHPVLARIVIVMAGVLLTTHLANLCRDEHDALSQIFWKRNLDLFIGISGKIGKSPLAKMEKDRGSNHLGASV